jgi:hypothetical protein
VDFAKKGKKQAKKRKDLAGRPAAGPLSKKVDPLASRPLYIRAEVR